jgi:hypothetical protein
MKPAILSVWLPASKVGRVDITPVAWFVYDFASLVDTFAARTTIDRYGGGAGPVHYFLIRMPHRRVAAFSSWERKPGYVELSLKANERGVVYWEDYEDAMAPLNVPLQEVHRHGAFSWRRRHKLIATSTEP